MKVVYKYKLLPSAETELNLPVGARVLRIDEQHGEVMLWALIDLEQKVVTPRIFAVHGTGHEFSGRMNYINTFFLQGKTFVFHAFELIK